MDLFKKNMFGRFSKNSSHKNLLEKLVGPETFYVQGG